jgi:hypothetical protein
LRVSRQLQGRSRRLACVGWPAINQTVPPPMPAGPLPPIVLIGTAVDEPAAALKSTIAGGPPQAYLRRFR